MKTLRNIALFTCIALNFSHALPSYKKPNLRQQQQQARYAAEHLHHISQESSSRFCRRHPHRHAGLSDSQRALLILLTTLMLLPTITATTPASYHEWPSAVHNVSYYDIGCGSDYRYGPKKTNADKSFSYYNTQENYTIARCAWEPSPRCVYFDLDGIIGGPSEFSRFNVTATFIEASQEYDKQPHTYQIAEETTALLKSLTWGYEQNVNGSACMTKLAYPPGRYHVLSDYERCGDTHITDICTQPSILPTLQHMINTLADQFDIPIYARPGIFIYDNEQCGGCSDATVIAFTVAYSDEIEVEKNGIIIPYCSLLQHSDDQLASILAHEMYHFKRFIVTSHTGSNEEVEADINSIFALDNAYMVAWMGGGLEWKADLPPFTDNLGEMINYLKICSQSQVPHPADPIRIAILLRMRAYDQEAGALLRLTEKK
jgi:hypothetical protein